jgi:transcriptional regulator with XRE-family HTH domain
MIGLDFIMNLYDKRQKDLADELGIKRQNINSWLGGNRKIPKKYLPKLADIFVGIDEVYFQKELNELDKLKIQQAKLDHDTGKINILQNENTQDKGILNDVIKIFDYNIKLTDSKIDYLEKQMNVISISNNNPYEKHEKMINIYNEISQLKIEKTAISRMYRNIIKLNNK